MGLIILFLFFQSDLTGQDSSLDDISRKYVLYLSEKGEHFYRQIERKNSQVLLKIKSQDSNLKSKFKGIDSAKSEILFNSLESQYVNLEKRLSNNLTNTIQYIPDLDSFNTYLKYVMNKKKNL